MAIMEINLKSVPVITEVTGDVEAADVITAEEDSEIGGDHGGGYGGNTGRIRTHT